MNNTMSSDTSGSDIYRSEPEEQVHHDKNAEPNRQNPKPIKSLYDSLQDMKSSNASSDTKTIKQLKEVIESGTECDVQTLYDGAERDQPTWS